ncbi:ABC transporter, substrate binding protein [Pectobacterium atrosepticum SCRI1043]|uniref:ABC transporter, substrate binding protein n=1 Tax=Pectobacterium atrosepticum (strain SCRI 1043 / ATCC BAA-672) TaxID=218491 RepID=Q6D583_PECAS|nr:transporter substrate-binding domain-containing protein [Pectobacterium atrosepticum]GKV83762.1 ABC transporter substrate-binding protein [Pectobacterium carotovorum subsp. carotovorum]AIA70971.1 ABC transporter substrate-binding protein [Pectobacterium atrosepticum]AIK14205.1 ABC transporter, substrate binding protein [Pectobacterium atrosepticum]ATY91016.1 ABC transporter substrate-binding protein [Pectobacterium atrosepticum]KFX12885.1 ABC transporter substrate-binding protein [Pectobact
MKHPNFITVTGLATLLSATLAANVQAQDAGFVSRIDLKANQVPIRTDKNAEAIAQIPANFKFVTPGKLTIAVSALSSPPLSLLADDNKTIVGSDADIARLVADSLGLDLKLVPASWEDWPLGITAGKYDAAIFNIAVTKLRKEKFDFATYRIDTLGFYVKSTSKITAINKPEDVAGLKVIVGSGTNQENILLGWDRQNHANGLAPEQPVYVTDDAAANLSIQSGRVDAFFGPHSIGAYKAALTGKTRMVGKGPTVAYVAVTTQKGNGLAQPISTAINGAIHNGSYAQVLDRWGEDDEKITQSVVNPPGIGD